MSARPQGGAEACAAGRSLVPASGPCCLRGCGPSASPARLQRLPSSLRSAGPAEAGRRSSGRTLGPQLRLVWGSGQAALPAGVSACSALWVLMTQPVMYVNICNACKYTHLLEPCFPAPEHLPPPRPEVAMCPIPRADPTSMCPQGWGGMVRRQPREGQGVAQGHTAVGLSRLQCGSPEPARGSPALEIAPLGAEAHSTLQRVPGN